MRYSILLLGLLIPAVAGALDYPEGYIALPTEEADVIYKHAILRGLDKVTARISELEIPIGDHAKFGNLDVTAHLCWKAPQEERPETKILLEIWDTIPGQESTRVFFGWMFASSPGLSALEHPVYDITVVDCVAE